MRQEKYENTVECVERTLSEFLYRVFLSAAHLIEPSTRVGRGGGKNVNKVNAEDGDGENKNRIHVSIFN